jgi:hypothetical protein
MLTLALLISWPMGGVARLAGLWWAAEEGMVAVCSVAWVLAPWEVAAGQDQCSALLQFDLGKLGAAILALLALRQVAYKGL